MDVWIINKISDENIEKYARLYQIFKRSKYPAPPFGVFVTVMMARELKPKSQRYPKLINTNLKGGKKCAVALSH